MPDVCMQISARRCNCSELCVRPERIRIETFFVVFLPENLFECKLTSKPVDIKPYQARIVKKR